MNKYLFIAMMLVATNVHAWGQPATARTTIKARVTSWTENPCNYGDRFAEACEYAKRYNLFRDYSTSETVIYSDPAMPQQDKLITNYE